MNKEEDQKQNVGRSSKFVAAVLSGVFAVGGVAAECNHQLAKDTTTYAQPVPGACVYTRTTEKKML